jgi:hypothetical protein
MAPLSDGRGEMLSDSVGILDLECKVETVRTILSVAKGLEEMAPLSDGR